jgi:hypothetical protein
MVLLRVCRAGMKRTCGFIGASRAMVTTARGTSYADLWRAPTLSSVFSSTTATYPAVSGHRRLRRVDWQPPRPVWTVLLLLPHVDRADRRLDRATVAAIAVTTVRLDLSYQPPLPFEVCHCCRHRRRTVWTVLLLLSPTRSPPPFGPCCCCRQRCHHRRLD